MHESLKFPAQVTSVNDPDKRIRSVDVFCYIFPTIGAVSFRETVPREAFGKFNT